MRTVEIWDDFERAQDKIEKLQRRAAKLGLVLEDQVHGYHVFERKETVDGRRMKVRHEVVELGFSLPSIKLAGWHFVASVDHAPHLEECVVRGMPGYEESGISLSQFATSANSCSHCRMDRPRKTTYVVQHEDGRVERVGSTCLRDFLGLDPKRVLAMLRFAAGEFLVDEEFRGGRGTPLFDSVELLSVAAWCIRAHGWVSAGQARDDYSGSTRSTRETAETTQRLIALPKGNRDHVEDERTEQDYQAARDALAWGRALTVEECLVNPSSDYLTNLRVVCQADVHADKHAGILVSVLVAHARHLEREVERASAATKTNEHVGEVGAMVNFEDLTIVALRYFDGDYGVTTLVKFEDAEGHLLTWFASGEKDYEVGQEFPVFRGKVKAHTEYKGRLETRLSHCKVPKAKK